MPVLALLTPLAAPAAPSASGSPSAAATASATTAASPSPSASVTSGITQQLDQVIRGDAARAATTCTSGDGTFCGLLRHAGLSDAWATALTTYGEPLVKIVVVVAAAVAIRSVVHRLIHQLTERIATGEPRSGWFARPATDVRADPAAAGGTVAWERRAQRARTLGSVLGSMTTGALTLLAALLVLGLLGLDLAPLLAGASVVGVAVGFGAQSLVKDVLSGMFLIAEDQFGVGDNIDLANGTTGTVEAVGLRVTRLRSVDGTVWYVRNGEVLRVGNRSQGWARAVVDVDVAYGEDLAVVERAMGEAGEAVHADPDWSAQLLEEPSVWGIEALSADKVVVRLAVRTAPLEQWAVARELRRRIKERFDAAGIGHEVQAADA